MNNNPGPGKALELLDGLKGLVRDLTARANKLHDDFRTRMARERARREAALEEQARQSAEALSQADADYAAAQNAIELNYERRKLRLGKAYQASKEKGLESIENQTGARKYEFQKTMLQAERDREAGLAANVKRFEEYKASLAEEEALLAGLERAVQVSFGGYRRFLRLFARAYEKAQADLSADENALLEELRQLLAKAGGELKQFRHHLVLRLFRYWPLWLLLALCEVPLVPLLRHFGHDSFSYPAAAGAAAATFALIFTVRHTAGRRAGSLAVSLANTLAKARAVDNGCQQKGEAHYQQELQRLQDDYQKTTGSVDQQLNQTLAKAGERRVSWRMRSDEKAVEVSARHEQLHAVKLERLARGHTETLGRLKREAEAKRQGLVAASQEREKKLGADYEADWRVLASEWQSRLSPLYAGIAGMNAFAEEVFPPWSAPVWKHWQPPERFLAGAKFGHLAVDVARLCEGLPKDSRLALPGPARFSLALSLAYPEQGSILFETAETGQEEAIGALNNIILRLLATAPPGRLNFSILDPVGLGQNFAGVMHLADYEEQIINSRIWTQSTQIEQRLAELNEHMEKVIQMYLRNEYATIAQYNEQAGVIAEKYHFLVVADFPVNFSETAAKRLLSIAASGARCGVYTLIHWDRRQPLPQEFIPEELRKSSFCVSCKGKDFVVSGNALPGADLVIDAPPPPDLAIEFIHQVGFKSRDSSRVEVPFAQVTPSEAEVWSEDTTNELRVPIGRTGATKLQYLAIGKGTRQHGLIAGKTGSGKSTLFHVIITNLALWCSPEAVEFYLVDFKKGVEFKCYAAQRLPHARVVAIESDREFGLSVLQRVDEELKRRGDLFRALGVQDLAGYKRAGGAEPVPRCLLIIDEFQEFFVEDDRIAQTASLLLDRIVRQGRAFGLHVLLGSQTLGGAYTVARTTLGQMVIRIALQCNEADAYLIMDDNNAAPRLLSRPGEGIYNDMAGMLEGNSPFQVVWLPDDVRESYLAKVGRRAEQERQAHPGPIVFEGNAPADVRENAVLQDLLAAESLKPTVAPRIWLGAPNSIKGPTEAIFYRQSGNNLLLVGQREEAILAILALSLLALAAQYPLGGARFILCDGTAPGSPQRAFLEGVLRAIPHPVTVAKAGDLAELMSGLAAELKQRAEATDAEAAPPLFLVIHALQKYTRLRYEEDFGFAAEAEGAPNAAAVLNNLVCEGTRLGFHVLASCDTYNNVNRFLSRKAFSEFEMRVLFQMSANDSASLIDNPKASILGLHRALFFNEQEGHLETFRPYALPAGDWIEAAGRNLARLQKQPSAPT
ncbi:MAG: FtsK/SpoIIIE domain-containing protein [Verrucomicrobiota bacterium]